MKHVYLKTRNWSVCSAEAASSHFSVTDNKIKIFSNLFVLTAHISFCIRHISDIAVNISVP